MTQSDRPNRNPRLLVCLLATIALSANCSRSGKGANQPSTIEATEESPSGTASAPGEANPKERFAQDCDAGIRMATEKRQQIVTMGGRRTVENLLVPYNELQMALEQSLALAELMDAVHPEEEIRQAARDCEKKAKAFATDLSLNRDLYDAFIALDTTGTDADTKRLVDKILRDYRWAGVDKEPAVRERLRHIDQGMVALEQLFAKNIKDDVRHISVQGVEGLKGLPEDYIAGHKPDESGVIRITTEYPDYLPFMQYAERDDLRKQLYIARKSRAAKSNEQVLKELLTLRAEKAAILGYANWADYATEDKMMKSAKNAAAFINNTAKTASKRAKKDYKELLAWKRKHGNKRAKEVNDWEKTYIEDKVKRERYSFDSQSVRPYFPYEQVEKGLLSITSAMFGIEYVPATNVDLWHPDVTAFDVKKDGVAIGRIYLDMHPRPGKYGHAAQFTLRSGVVDQQLPEGVLVCNFPNPRTEKGPALMVHEDVVTMFHEFGHLMHHILGGQQKWIQQSGVATEWDFVEAPSQMLEEWAWNYETLSTFAKHYETGETIGKDVVERMRKADTFGIGVQILQQLFYAAVSLEFHRVAPKALDMQKTVRTLQEKYTPFSFVENTSLHTSFGHLTGYSAIYYTYMWSLVIAKDLFTPFEQHGLMNTEWTYRYRDEVLAKGGTKDAAALVSDFLGRPYNTKAFEAYLAK